MKSKKCKRNTKVYAEKHPDVDTSSFFKSITQSQASSVLESQSAKSEVPGLTVPEDNPKYVHRPTALESPRICLFSNQEFDGVKKCLDHMRLKHNFIIPDIDCLVDLKGLLNYVAQRIQLGCLCLYCSKEFKSPQACQQHMIDMAHCRINMDDEEEYLDFYDFTKTYENHPDAVIKEEEKVKAQEKDKEASEESWDDCDEESLDPADIDEGFQIVEDSEQSFAGTVEESKLGSTAMSGI